MPDIPTARSLMSTPQEHLADHLQLALLHNAMAMGPFNLTHSSPNINTSGVVLWTPNVGDRIVGLWVEFTEVWDTVNEEIGLGITGTVDADLAYRFPTATMLPSHPTFPRGEGFGTLFGASVTRLLTQDPIVAKTVIGGNTTGGLNLWLMTLPASAF